MTKITITVPPAYREVAEVARLYAKSRGLPLSAFIWEAVESYLREKLGEEELSGEELEELDRIEAEMDRGEFIPLEELKKEL